MNFLAVGFGTLSGDIEQALSDMKLYSSYQHKLACSAEVTRMSSIYFTRDGSKAATEM